MLDTGNPAERVCSHKSYTDLGKGIIHDIVTWLEWQQALDYVDLLNAERCLGYSD